MLPAQSLQVSSFDPIVEKQPINVHYQKYTADSFSSSSVTFNVDSPFAGAMLDNEVLIEYKVTLKPHSDAVPDGTVNGGGRFAFQNMFEGAGPAGGGQNARAHTAVARTEGRMGLSAGWAVHNSLSSVSLTINGQTITQTPRKWMPEFMRFFASPHEEKSVCSLSGGEFDTGDYSTRTRDGGSAMGLPTYAAAANSTLAGTGYNLTAAGAVARRGRPAAGLVAVPGNNEVNLPPLYPTAEGTWYNDGYSKRWYRFAEHARLSGATAGSARPNAAPADSDAAAAVQNFSRYADEVSFTVYERVPASPFLLWDAKDGKHSIPYIDKMELDLRFVSDLTRYSMQGKYVLGDGFAPAAASIPLMSFLGTAGTSAPILHLKWYIPPPGMVMAPQVSIPIQKIKELSIVNSGLAPAIAVTEVRSGEIDMTYANIRLQQIPDLLFVYAKLQEGAQLLRDPVEQHLEITELRITVNGDSGKVLQASSGRLFSLYLKNSPMARERNYDYQEWRKRYCTCVLTPEDMGVLQPPGINHGVTLDVLAKARSHWVYPTVGQRPAENPEGILGRAYDLHVMAIYDKYELTLTNRGNAQLKLLNVPSPSIAPQLAEPDQADLAQQFA